MELINTDALLKEAKGTGAYWLIKAIVTKLPKIDAEPVVRCKDCKYFTNNIADENLRKNFCDRIQVNCFHPVKENDFCSYAEKTSEEK